MDSGTTLMLSGRHDSERVQRRHFPEIANRSIVDFSPPKKPPREFLLTKGKHVERRHVVGNSGHFTLGSL
ncbi:hypothetical protein HHI36_019989 [Cryptolaemus montrouzieri]|uniref:Uncharacterized protein n=1 Tax=Cryptolaemus montrouzieri TaxID=559131 RepID=A0ABD2N8W4_9CUCU